MGNMTDYYGGEIMFWRKRDKQPMGLLSWSSVLLYPKDYASWH